MTIYVNARFVTQPLTGVQRYAFEICKHLKSIDAGIVFLCPRNIRHYDWARHLEVKIIGSCNGHLWEQSELPLYLSRQHKPILFSPCNTGPLLFSRQMLTLHDLSFRIYPQYNSFLFAKWYRFLVSRLCKKVLHIFTVSETVKSEIMQYFQVEADRISVTYNGVADEMKLSPKRKLHKEKIILTVGSFNGRKNVDFLIRGFLASGLATEYTLVIIGNTNPIYKYSRTEKHSSIQIINDANDALVTDYYAHAEIACFLSVYEGFGIPVLESLQYACKVLCADIPVFRELYEDSVYFCDPYNEQQLSGLLHQLPAMPVLQQDTLEILNQKFDYQRSATAIYQKLSHA